MNPRKVVIVLEINTVLPLKILRTRAAWERFGVHIVQVQANVQQVKGTKR